MSGVVRILLDFGPNFEQLFPGVVCYMQNEVSDLEGQLDDLQGQLAALQDEHSEAQQEAEAQIHELETQIDESCISSAQQLAQARSSSTGPLCRRH